MMDIVNHLDTRKGENLYVQAKFVVDTLNHYMSSSDDLITTAHVPQLMMDKNGVFVPIEHHVRMVRLTKMIASSPGGGGSTVMSVSICLSVRHIMMAYMPQCMVDKSGVFIPIEHHMRMA